MSEAIKVLSIVLGIVMLIIGVPVLVIALIPYNPLAGLFALSGIILLSAGVLLVYFGIKREERIPVRPLPLGGDY